MPQKKHIKYILCAIACIILAGCSSPERQDGPPKRQIDISNIKNPVPKKLKVTGYGNPKSYTVKGKTYTPLRSGKGYVKRGLASWYGTKFNGQLTSSGETYDMLAMTAANKILPIPCYVKVTNLDNHKSIIVKVNDRGPFKEGRIIDLSYVAALKLDVTKHGTAPVEVQYIDPDANVTHQGFTALYVQAGAFHNEHYAYNLKNNISKKLNQPVIIKRVNADHKTLYRVKVGPLKRLEQVDKVTASLKKMGVKHPLLRVT